MCIKMGSKQSKTCPSVDKVIEIVNEKLKQLPKRGSYRHNEFLENKEEIKNNQTKYGISSDAVDAIVDKLYQINDLEKIKKEAINVKYNFYFKTIEKDKIISIAKAKEKELNEKIENIKNEIYILQQDVPNPIVDESIGEKFWLKIYNLIIHNAIANRKYKFIGKSDNISGFDGVSKIPVDITFNQLNMMLNTILYGKETKFFNLYESYTNNEEEFVKKLLNIMYSIDHIYRGLTRNLEVLNIFSQSVKDFILMHILINNAGDFVGPFKYSVDNEHLQLPKSIEESEQYQNVKFFDDAYDILMFTVSSRMESMSFLYDPVCEDFINRKIKSFDITKENMSKEENEKERKN